MSCPRLLLFAGLALLASAPARSAGRKPGEAAYRRAAEDWKRRVEKDPEDPEARFNLGQALYRSGDFAGAADSFAAAEPLFKDDARRAEAAYDAGNALAREGKADEALEKYKSALRRAPDDVDAKHNYELVKKRQKEKKKGGDGKDAPGGKKDNDAGEGKASPAENAKESMSKEDAERILQAVERQEKEARRKVKAPGADRPAAGEDW